MWFALAFLSAFLLRVALTHRAPHVHTGGEVELRAAAAAAVCVCVRLSWSGRSLASWLACLFLIRMPLNSSAEESGAAGGIFSLLPFLFSPFQATLVASSRVSFSIFSFPHSFVHFSVYIPTVWLSCALSLTFLFFCLSFFFYLLEKLTGLSKFQGQALPSLFTNPKTHESFLFMIRQASEWCCWGLCGANCAFEYLNSVQWSMVRNRLVFLFLFLFHFVPFLNYFHIQMNIVFEVRSLSSRCTASKRTHAGLSSHTHTGVEGMERMMEN